MNSMRVADGRVGYTRLEGELEWYTVLVIEEENNNFTWLVWWYLGL